MDTDHMQDADRPHRHGLIGMILDVAVRFRWAMVVLTLGVAIFGVVNLLRLPIDAVPDITNVQVQINTEAPALSPSQVETQVTYPVETGLAGIEGLEMTRSISRNGFSQVTAIFEEGTDIYFARQQVNERLTPISASLPEGAEPVMGPISTGLGEVLMYTIEYEYPDGKEAPRGGAVGWQSDGSFVTERGDRLDSDVAKAAYLRTIQDWVVAPLMRSVDGVAGVDSIGGFEKQYLVQPDPARLTGYGLSFDEVIDALEAANLAEGANFVERAGEALLARVDARLGSVEDIEQAVVSTREGVPIRVGDIATVSIGGDLRTGAASLNGDEAVVGTVLMRAGENSRTVSAQAAERLEEVRSSLPKGIVAEIVYNRSSLVDATIATVEKNLVEGALLVIAILFLLLGNIRAAIIAALVIPFSMLMASIGMNRLGVSGNLMSLGALDFGLIVDGAVIIVENSVARLAARQEHEGRLLTLGERLTETRLAAQEMIKPTVYGQAIILLVFAPLLTFTGVEGKTFSPMAITVMLALASAFVLSLTFVPAMIAILLNKKLTEKEVRPIRIAKERYGPLVRRAITRPWPVIGMGVGIFAFAAFVFSFLGSEFTPQLDERDIAVQSLRIPSTSLERSLAMQRRVEDRLEQFEQVQLVFSRTGTAEVASDPMPPNASDAYVILKPREEWPDPDLAKDELVAQMESALSSLVGNLYEFSQPIELRFNELIAGVRGDVAVKIYGDDLSAMTSAANEVAGVLRNVDGAADVKVQQVTGFPTLYCLRSASDCPLRAEGRRRCAIGGDRTGRSACGPRFRRRSPLRCGCAVVGRDPRRFRPVGCFAGAAPERGNHTATLGCRVPCGGWSRGGSPGTGTQTGDRFVQRARTRPRVFCRRGPGKGCGAGRTARCRVYRVGRSIPEPPGCSGKTSDRHSHRVRGHSPVALHGGRGLGAGARRIQRDPAGPGRRNILLGPARDAILGFCGGRLYRPVGRSDLERARDGDCDPSAARQGHGAR